jgi:hypothetical protein
MAGLRSGHPRPFAHIDSKDVDARHKAGHDEKHFQSRPSGSGKARAWKDDAKSQYL